MSSLVDTQEKIRRGFSFHLIANGMILIGVVALATAVFKGISDANIYNSPFDEVDSAEDGGKGFLPVVVDPDSESGLSAAPTLSVTEFGAGINEDELAQVMAVIRSSRNGVANAGDTKIFIPDRIVIPSINLDAPILLADFKEIPFWGKTYTQWTAPNAKAVGWHYDSASLGQPGNMVLNGHHNIYGEIFRYLSEVTPGSIIYIYSGDQVLSYIVGLVDILPEKFQSVEDRLDNAQWTLPSEDERITLISCWPYESNTHRVIVVAVPIELDGPVP